MAKKISKPDVLALRKRTSEPTEYIAAPVPLLSGVTPVGKPEVHVEAELGRYIRSLELLYDFSVRVGRHELASNIMFGLIKLSKLGKPKVDVGFTRQVEMDLTKLPLDQLERILGAAKVEN